jgi:nickel/cobalt transporter (NicO) family protein
MNEAVLTTIAITGFGIAFFHAAIPTHWLPFVLTARVQRWTHTRTLLITAFAGTGHVLFTAFLGLLLTLFGFALHERIGQWFPRIAGSALILFGIFYISRQILGSGHSHTHLFGGHPHAEPEDRHTHEHVDLSSNAGHTLPPPMSDRVAITSLLALLTFSPCEAFLPIYVSGIRYGWMGFALLTAILSVATVAGMIVFTWLTLSGMKRISLRQLEKYELGLMGALLCLVGILIILFEK